MKPCPFCGNPHVAITLTNYRRNTVHVVECPKCLARGPIKVDIEPTKAAWNTRSSEEINELTARAQEAEAERDEAQAAYKEIYDRLLEADSKLRDDLACNDGAADYESLVSQRDEFHKSWEAEVARRRDLQDRYDKLEAWAAMRDAGHDDLRTELNSVRAFFQKLRKIIAPPTGRELVLCEDLERLLKEFSIR